MGEKRRRRLVIWLKELKAFKKKNLERKELESWKIK